MKYLRILFLLVSVSGFTQSKVGTVDIEFILSKMPEIGSVQAGIEKYGKELDADLQKQVTSYDSLVADYQKNASTLTILQKQEKQKWYTYSIFTLGFVIQEVTLFVLMSLSWGLRA